jgi:hypothetical protein
MYVSFDDGDHWQSLRLNLPITSYRDAVIKDNDLVVGTYGRGFWILDDISPLRQMTPGMADEPAHLFKPGEAVRVRRNVNQDTPFPPEVPHSLNPPEGALIYYSLGGRPSGDITLDVLDAAGHEVRHMSSAPIAPVEEAAHPPNPDFWLATPQPIPTELGLNRVNWNLRYDDPPAFSHSWEINANPGLTPASPEGPLAPPGTYTVRLTVNGKAYTQTVSVRNDPRSPATAAALSAQHALEMKAYAGAKSAWDGYQQATALHEAAEKAGAGGGAVADAAKLFVAQLDSVSGGTGGGRGRGFGRGGGGGAPPSFRAVNGAMIRELGVLDPGDMAPTPAMVSAFAQSCGELTTAVGHWRTVVAKDLPAFNAVLTKNGQPALAAPAPLATPGC